MTLGHRLRPTAVEVASSLVFGDDPLAPPLPAVERATTPLMALEEAVLPALARPPCMVSFSGGRDSSAVLAVATRVARREGLPLPVPATFVFPGIAEAYEEPWQERVVRHLGLEDWHRHTVGDELDFVGPVATAVLRRHGVLWPPNTYVHAPLLEEGRGGSLMTGIDGDSLFGAWAWARLGNVVARRARPRRRDLLRLAHAAAPRPLRVARAARQSALKLPWLRPDAQRLLDSLVAADQGSEPVSWPARVRWWARRRPVAAVRWSLGLLAAEREVLAVHPLLEPKFLAALARHGGTTGYGGRTAIMRHLFAELLPDEVLARPDKALLSRPLWASHSRGFIAGWDGRGVDAALVDIPALRAAWSAPVPDGRSSLLVQSAWLASAAEDVEQPAGDDGEELPAGGAA